MRAVVQRSLAAKVTIAGRQSVPLIMDLWFYLVSGLKTHQQIVTISPKQKKKSVNCGFSVMMPANELGASRCRRASPINIAIHTVCRYTSR
ncbi:hypothetical protein S101520_03013 [Lactiplantibacillus plantarum subsp. plantarum]|nr:hypothetical protein S101520_03013 [Lactiplantibacillus plantarum subsp. plantarum]